MPTPVIIDCDPGHDDAMALLLALASPELELSAVTTVAGNQTLDKVTANAIRILDVAQARRASRSPPAPTAALIHPARVAGRGARRDRASTAPTCRRPHASRSPSTPSS